ncbi:hypothetical protein Trydic_g21218 [Trypoxylus dichotomus]
MRAISPAKLYRAGGLRTTRSGPPWRRATHYPTGKGGQPGRKKHSGRFQTAGATVWTSQRRRIGGEMVAENQQQSPRRHSVAKEPRPHLGGKRESLE